MNHLSEADQALAAAFVTGDLGEPERGAFELRLASDPALAAHVERMLSTDELASRHAAGVHASAPRRRGLRIVPLVLAAAALVIVFVAISFLLDRTPSRAHAQVALRPSFESAAEWIAREPELDGLRPPGLDELRGPGETVNADAHAFVESAREAELRALDVDGHPETTAAFYSIALRLEVASDVVVAAFPDRGRTEVLWPEPDLPARVEAGDHVLPGASFRVVDEGRGPRVEYRRGFLVPIGAERVVVVVATRPAGAEGIDAALRTPADTPALQESRLAAAGFDARAYVVHEPR